MLSNSASLILEYAAVLKCDVTGLASVPPATDLTPDRPAGIRSVNRVDGLSAASGVNVRVLPVACQEPGAAGRSAGSAP